jgi:hypothetical protein
MGVGLRPEGRTGCWSCEEFIAVGEEDCVFVCASYEDDAHPGWRAMAKYVPARQSLDEFHSDAVDRRITGPDAGSDLTSNMDARLIIVKDFHHHRRHVSSVATQHLATQPIVPRHTRHMIVRDGDNYLPSTSPQSLCVARWH